MGHTPTRRPIRSGRRSMRVTRRSSSSCRRWSSWPSSTAAPAKRTSARTSSRCWISRARSGSKIRSAGTSTSIPTTRSAGRLKRRRCCSRASRSAPSTGCSPATGASCGSTAKPRWCAAAMDVRGSSTAWRSTSATSNRRRWRSRTSAISSPPSWIRSPPWYSCRIRKGVSCASTAPAKRRRATASRRCRAAARGICSYGRRKSDRRRPSSISYCSDACRRATRAIGTPPPARRG